MALPVVTRPMAIVAVVVASLAVGAGGCGEPTAPPGATFHVTLSSDSVSMKPGQTATLSAEVRQGAVTVTGVSVSYRSTDVRVATVRQDGSIVAVAPGRTSIVARCDEAEDTAVVVVRTPHPTRFVFAPASVTLAAGDSAALMVTVYDEDGDVMAATPAFSAAAGGPVTVSAGGTVRTARRGRGWVRVAAGTLRDSVQAIVFRSFPGTARSVPIVGYPFGVAAGHGIAVVTLFDSNAVRRLDLATLALSAPLAVGAGPTDVVLSPDGSRAYSADQTGLSVTVIDVAAWAVVATFPVTQAFGTPPNRPIRIAVASDGTRLFVGTANGAVHILDAVTGALDTTIAVGMDVRDLDVTPDGQRLVGVTLSGMFFVMRTADHQVETWQSIRGPQPAWTYGAAVPRDSAFAFVAGELGTRLVRLQSGLPTDTILPDVWGEHLRLTPDDQLLLVPGRSSSAGRQGLSVVDPIAEHLVRFFPTAGAHRVAVDRMTGAIVSTAVDGVHVVR